MKNQVEYTCSPGERNKDGKKELILIFGMVVEDDGSRFAIVSPWPVKVPIDEVIMYENPKDTLDS